MRGLNREPIQGAFRLDAPRDARRGVPLTPVLVQLVWIYYALPVLIGVELSPAVAAFIALSFYGGAFYSEIIRGGICRSIWGNGMLAARWACAASI